MGIMIEVHGLAKYFGRFSALRDLSLNVKEGEFIALFGRNGAGKTTFLRILAGLSRPSSGEIRVGGADSPRVARGMMGYLSHNTALYADLTALENLRFFARLMELPCGDSELFARISRVGLAGREKEPVRNYSRGMQQRLAIARAVLHRPSLMLLDEPYTGLDQDAAARLESVMSTVGTEGRTVVMTTHDLERGLAVADRVVILAKGRVAFEARRTDLDGTAFREAYRHYTQS